MNSAKTSEQKRINQILAILVVILSLALGISLGRQQGWWKSESVSKVEEKDNQPRTYLGESIILPAPSLSGKISLEETLQNRRSRRSYTSKPLSLKDISQLLWSLQGKTSDWGGRTAPSAKSAYPLEVTVVVKNAQGLNPGVYHFISDTHTLRQTIQNVPEKFDEAAAQKAAQTAPIVFILSGDAAKITKAFDGVPHDEDVYLEAGHAAQNLYLQAESLHLGTVVMGGFNAQLMQTVLSIPENETLIYQIPVGYPSET